MAKASGSSSVVYLTSIKFPPKFEDVFCARSQSSKQNVAAEKVMITGSDRRQRIIAHDTADCDYYGSGCPGIGLLRMEFNGTPFIGTASIFAKGSYLLTCAHNVVEYDATTKEFVYATNAWFELRDNKIGCGSALIKRYEVTKIAVYPRYFEDPTSASGFDLALCWINVPRDDRTVEQLYGFHMPFPVAGGYYACRVAVVGFPGEHAGEKWGVVADVPSDRTKDWHFTYNWQKVGVEKEILVYQFIDTSPGQSGSPVMGGTSNDILGVHTGGSASLKKNWATYITPDKLKWIADSLGSPWKVLSDYGTLYLSHD